MSAPVWRPPARTGPPRQVEITRRPATILSGLCLGLSTQRIAHELGISEDTTKSHVKTLLRALGARDRTDAVALAMSGHVRITVRRGRGPAPRTRRT